MDASLFGQLSGELRDYIYEIALREGHEDVEMIELRQESFDKPFHTSQPVPSPENGNVRAFEPLLLAGLPCTCRQVRRESLRLYYSINRFCFETEYLRSKHKSHIVEQLHVWVKQIGRLQAREIRDVTISLASVKGRPVPLEVDWSHMCLIRSLFHPQADIKIRFFLDGTKTATFALGTRASIEEQLDGLAALWTWRWQKFRVYSEPEARKLAERYRRDVARLFDEMPEYV